MELRSSFIVLYYALLCGVALILGGKLRMFTNERKPMESMQGLERTPRGKDYKWPN